jgi:hypothetical protein
MKPSLKIVNSYIWGGTMTDEIIHLLNERNRHLAQFSSLNKIQLDRVLRGDFDQIGEFYEARERLLVVIEKIELIINEKVRMIDSTISIEVRKNIDLLLKNKDQLIKEILDQDLKIMSCIETEKAVIISKLKGLAKGRKTINAYKSGISSAKIDEDV